MVERKLPKLPSPPLPSPPTPPAEAKAPKICTRQVTFSETLLPLQGITMEEPCPLTGEIIEVTMAFPDGCLESSALITLNDGNVKTINKMKDGEKLLCHSSADRVLETFERDYSGEMYRVKPLGCLDFLITPEQPVWAIKRDSVLCAIPSAAEHNVVCQPWKCPRKGCTRKREWSLKWIATENLERGDLLVIKVPREVEDTQYIDITALGVFNRDDERFNKIPDKIPITRELLKLVGYYLAEGCTHTHGAGANCGVQFTFGDHEQQFVEDVKESAKRVFGIDSYSRKRGSCFDVELGGKVVAELFEALCGKYAQGKNIHPVLMSLPPEKQMWIVEGFFNGDGYRVENKYAKVLTTVNKELAYQFWIILWRNSLNPTVCSITIPEREIEGRKLQKHLMYNVYWFENHKHCRRYFFEDHALTPIWSIEKELFNGKIHNLHTENYNSYVVNGIVVHNCNGLVELQFGHGGLAVLPSKKEEFIALNNSTPTFRNLREQVTKGERLWAILRNGDAVNPHKPSIIVVINGVE